MPEIAPRALQGVENPLARYRAVVQAPDIKPSSKDTSYGEAARSRGTAQRRSATKET